MSDTWRENAIVQAIDIVTNKRIAQASFNTSIKAIVKQIKDKAIGEYILRYQDSDIIAYAASPNVNYIEGDQVIVQVPMNDLTQQKTILSTTVKHPSTFSDIPKDSDLYNRLGTNVVISQGTLQLSSYANTVSVIYNKQSNDNIIDIDINAVNNYIKRGNGLAVGMFVQTLLDDSQVGGDYGLVITADFEDAKGAAATRSYVVSSKDVIGNPYSLKKPTFVERFFDDIDIDEFKGISSISIYCDGFPQNEDKDTILDIIFSNLQIYGAGSLTQKQLSGLTLHIDYSQDGDTIGDEKNKIKVVAQLKVKGKVTTQNIRYYWFVQNGAIYKGGINTKGYSPLAGDGWECVNQFEDPISKTKPVGLQTGQFTFCLPERDTTTQSGYKDPGSGAAALFQKQNRIKCVAEYSSIKQHISSQCIIYNSSMSAFDAKIVSSDILASGSNKTIYYVDNGSPSLTCKVYNEGQQIENLNNYSFYWTVVPMAGQVKEITDIITEKEKNIRDLYTKYLKVYNSLSEGDRWIWGALQISEEDRISSQYGDNRPNKKEFLEWLQKEVKKYNQELKIQGNVLYHFPIASISGSSKINCAIFEKEQIDTVQKQVYLGSTSITLYNKPQLTGMYSLNLENGTQVFQYDKKGNSPASAIYEKPLVIQPLTFVFLDNTNKEIPFDQIIHEGQVKWKIPNKQTMLLYNGEEKGQINQDFTVYTNLETFPYTIASNYDAKKNNNNIQLTVRYKDIVLDTYTNFTFPKDGDPGTNGTDYVAKLIPEREDADAVYISNFTRSINKEGILPFDNQGRDIDRLKFLVYNNSKEHEIKVDTNYTTGLLKDGNNSLVLLSAEKNNKIYFNTENLLDTTDDFNFKTWVNDKKPVDIIRNSIKISNTTEKEGQTDQVRELTYYAQYPIIFNYIIKDDKHSFPLYRIKLKPKTGFKYVVYSEDGTLPDYDNTLPFELIVEEVVIIESDNNEDITYYQPIDSNKIGYNWSVIGNLSSSTQNTLSTFVATPLPSYDGENVSSAVLCEVSKENNIIGYIHIPIYMSINRYGHTALNEWDGNSIDLKLDKNGKPIGDTILAPQVGAGKKNTDNTFTGVLIGVERPRDGSKDKTGLFGYSSGQRSIFLDADTGNATFGKSGSAQIKIDARSGQGTIASGDYSQSDKTGMKIKFSSDEDGPYIKYGSGHFSVDENGNITAQGGGTIAGWTITDSTLYKSNVGLNSNTNNSSYDPNNKPNDASLSTDKGNMAFWAGTGSGNEAKNFYVTHNGYLFSKSGKIGGWNITENRLSHSINNVDKIGMYAPSNANNDTIGFYAGGTSGNRPFSVTYGGYLKSTSGKIASWSIGQQNLTNGKVGMGQVTFLKTQEDDKTKNPFKEAIIARLWGGSSNLDIQNNTVADNSNSGISGLNFALSTNGYLYSKAGIIGGWKITEDGLLYGNKTGSGAKTYTELSSDGTLINKVNGTTKWQIGNDGTAVFYNIDAKGGKIGSWDINSGAITAGNNVSLNSDGSITAKNGTIAGFTINGNQIKSTNLTLDGSDGSIIGKGTAQFSKLSGQIEDGKSLTGNGVGMGGPGVGSYVNPSSTYSDDTKTKKLDKRIQELAVTSLDVSDSLTFQNYSCKWQQVKIYTGATLNYITPSNIVTRVDFENQKAYGFSPSKIITNVKLIYRNLWLLTGDTVPGGEDSGSQDSLVDGREIM